MNEIFDKLGLYDLVAVLLSGISMVVVTLIANQYIWKISSDKWGILDNSLIFIVTCYLVGVIFQEIGSQIMGYIFRNDKLLKEAMGVKVKNPEAYKDYKYMLTETERKQLNDIFDGIDDLYKYNFCRFYLLRKKKGMSRPDKDQAIAAFSRSMIFYLIGLVFFIIMYGRADVWVQVIGVIVTVASGTLFYCRYIRFTKMRYVYIMRNFLFFYEMDKSNDSED